MNSAFVATVSGRVHMVMYRDFTQHSARALGIVGEVKNMPDGTVHVVAEGERGKLEKLIEKLKQGPFLSRVDGVMVQWTEPTGQYTGFPIAY